MLRVNLKADSFNLGIILEASYLVDDTEMTLSEMLDKVLHRSHEDILAQEYNKIPNEMSLNISINIETDNSKFIT